MSYVNQKVKVVEPYFDYVLKQVKKRVIYGKVIKETPKFIFLSGFGLLKFKKEEVKINILKEVLK